MGWEIALDAVDCLSVSVSSWRGCERARVAVHCLAAWVRIPKACCAVLMKVPADWVNVCNVRVWLESLVTVHFLAALVKI